MPGDTAPTAPVTDKGAAQPDDKNAPKPGEAKAEGSDVLEVILEGMDKPTKIPLEKVKPDLDKFRKDADRKLSEADRKGKAADAIEGKYKALAARAKEDPDVLEELAKELGIPEDQLEAMSEKRVARALQKAIREAEEGQHPEKKAERERTEEGERLRKENADLKAKADQAEGAQRMARAEGMVVQTLDHMGANARNPETAQQVVWALRLLAAQKQAELPEGQQVTIADLGDAVSPEKLAKTTLETWAASAAKFYEVHPDAELPEAVLKRAEDILAKRAKDRPKHPAEGQGGTAPKGKRNEGNGVPASTAVLMKYLHL